MIEKLEFTKIDGSHKPGDITVYALSTCGHCRRALNFLDENNVEYRYVYVDLLPVEEKNGVKDDLKSKFPDSRVAFPFLVMDDTRQLTGFKEDEWKSTLSL